MRRIILILALCVAPILANAQMLQAIMGSVASSPPAPVFDAFPSLAPSAYCGVVKMRSAYAGNALQLALGATPAATLNVGWVTNARGVQVADDAAVQTWLAANGNDFARVAVCYDQSGNGLDYTAPTPLTYPGPPLYKGVTKTGLPAGQSYAPPLAEWLGLPSMNFYARNTIAGVRSFLNINASITTNRQAASLMMALSLNDSRPTGVVQAGQWLAWLGSAEFIFGNTGGTLQFSDGATLINSTVAPAVDWSVKGFTASGSQVCAYDDITSACQTNTYVSHAQSGGTIGADDFAGTTYTFDGNVTAILGPWSIALTPTQYGQVRDGLKAQLNISATPTAQIVFDGDSITEGYFGAFSEHHAQRAIARIYNDTGKRVRAYNVGIGARCIGAAGGSCPATTLTSEFVTKTQPLFSLGSYTTRILLLQAGINDIVEGGATGAATSGLLTTYIGNARSAVAGIKVVFGGIASATSAPFDAVCYTAMQAILAATQYDGLSGWYNDANMKCQSGGGTNFSNTLYYSGDNVHPNGNGHDVGSGYDATALESLLP